MRQDSTVRLSYEYEEEAKQMGVVDGGTAGRNPYLADYARQRAGGQRQKSLSLDWYPPADSRRGGRSLDAAGRRQGTSSPQTSVRRERSQICPPVQMNRQMRSAGSLMASEQRALRQMQTVRAAAVERRAICQAKPNSQRMPVSRQRSTGLRNMDVRNTEPGNIGQRSVQRGAVQRKPREGAEQRRTRENTARARQGEAQRSISQRSGMQKSGLPAGRAQRQPADSRSLRGRAAMSRRRQRVLMQRVAVGLWAFGILVLAIIFVVRNDQVSAAGGDVENSQPEANGKEEPAAVGNLVQGLPAEIYAKHPDWTENFLTPNEYSRPGDALESVKNIFVHYTANPGTSAAQNRSYFEQQKDTHEASVSAHFIIGYEGEIIQCVPLDEIAYAVMTRNYDSVSIECCYLARDGSFTQETYDSLISLLAWLTDAYDLDSNDILRHYDCGGKKCPIYYTEHPGAWEQLKKDVQAEMDA